MRKNGKEFVGTQKRSRVRDATGRRSAKTPKKFFVGTPKQSRRRDATGQVSGGVGNGSRAVLDTGRVPHEAKKKVFVGLSGGVDSSVAAALLQKEGYDVTGVFIKVWQADFLPCTWREERRDAMRAAAHLDIPFLTLDLEKEYKNEVVDYMLREYSAGRVPNPDVMCNKHVKFGAFLDFAKKHGADHVATGHYARVTQSNTVDGPLYRLQRGVDPEKDQSYFLWTLTQKQLAHILFPIGHLKKPRVRMLARNAGLPNADKKDSQGLCFMGPVNMEEFLSHYIPQKPGDVLDEAGHVVGKHNGAMFYTIGQRHGFVTAKNMTNELPYYVVGKNMKNNTVIVSHKFHAKEPHPSVTIEQVNMIPMKLQNMPMKIVAEIRYHGKKYAVKDLVLKEELRATLTLSGLDEMLSQGQSLVLYEQDVCLGGGIVTSP